jgi:biopolymer transport protein ExbB
VPEFAYPWSVPALGPNPARVWLIAPTVKGLMNQLVYYFREGGFLMYPLLACSLTAVAVILERAMRLRRSVLIDPGTIEDIQTQIEQGHLETAVTRHHNSPFLVGRILSKGLKGYAADSEDIETSLVEAGERGLQVLQKNLGMLSLIARVAPLLGLLGTVLGMIIGFEELERAGVGKENLAHAIRVALITTAAGLMVAIPVVIASAYFRSRIRVLTAEFEEVLLDVARSVKRAGRKAKAGDEDEAVSAAGVGQG